MAGKFLSFPDSAASDDVLISRKVADKLRLSVGDKTLFYFIQNPPRIRPVPGQRHLFHGPR